jgi:hypothetical protein
MSHIPSPISAKLSISIAAVLRRILECEGGQSDRGMDLHNLYSSIVCNKKYRLKDNEVDEIAACMMKS